MQTDTLQLHRRWFTGHKCRFWWGCIRERWNNAVYRLGLGLGSLKLSLEISQHISKNKKRTIEEGTFFPLINVSNRKTFVKLLPPFHLWVVNFDSFAVWMCGPRQRREVRHKGSFVAMLLWGQVCTMRVFTDEQHCYSGRLWGPFTRQKSPSSLRGCVSLLFPLLTQISGGRLKQSALTAQCGIKVAMLSGFPWEIINEMESYRSSG